MSKKEDAVLYLEKKLRELSSITNVKDGNSWKALVKDSLKVYLGESSDTVKRLEELKFTNYQPNDLGFGLNVYNDSNKVSFANLISGAIDYIKQNGLFKPPHQRGYFIAKNEYFWPLAVTIVIAFSGGGYSFGVFKFDESKNQLLDRNKILSDSIVGLNKESTRLRRVSDSALNTLGLMPYNELKLDSAQFIKVQSTIETTGAILNLISNND